MSSNCRERIITEARKKRLHTFSGACEMRESKTGTYQSGECRHTIIEDALVSIAQGLKCSTDLAASLVSPSGCIDKDSTARPNENGFCGADPQFSP